MKTKIPRKFALAFALMPGLTAVLSAQTAPTAADQTAPSDIVKLDVFTVNTSRDNGYVAVDSLAGGRNNTPIALTPSSMSSLTAAFIEDLQLTDVRSALRWTLNAVPVSWNGGHDGGGDVFNSWSYNIRGAGTGPQGGNPPTVNYFPFYGVKDLFNVDRVEVDRGPNSILFGVGNLGGTVSTYTKIPRFNRDFTNVNISTSNYGGGRFVADVNRVISLRSDKDLGVRFNVLADRDSGWRNGDVTKRYGGALATNFKLSDNTNVRLDLEAYQQETPQFAQNITDNYSRWDGQTNSPTWGAAPVGTADTRSMAEWGGPDNTLVWIPSQKSFMNWGQGFRGTGLNDTYTAYLRPEPYVLGNTGLTVPGLPSREFTVGPKDGTFNWRYYTATAYIDQKFGPNAEMELAAYRYDDKGVAKNFEAPNNSNVDINKQMPNGQPNPEYGKIYSELFLDRQIQDHSANEFRGQFNYHFDTSVFNVPLREWLSASVGHELHLLTTHQYMATDMTNYDPNNWTHNMIWGREYWDQPNTPMNLPSTINDHQIVYLPLPFDWFDHNLSEKIQYEGLVSQTRLWEDRLNLTLGARHDKYDSEILSTRGTGKVPVTESDSGTTYSAGLVGYVTKAIGLTYNYSENFAPIGGGVAPSLYGDRFGPATGKSNSFGVRVSTPDHKYYIAGTYYEDKAHGRITNDSIDIQGAWNEYFQAGGTKTDIGPAGTVTGGPGSLHANMSYADTEDVKNTGYEIEAVANPIENLRLQIGYSQPKSVVDNDLPGSRSYFATHLPDWQVIANSTPTDPTILGHVQNLQKIISNSQLTLANTAIEGTSAGLVKSTFNVFAVYSFTQDWARGFSIGGGATALGKQNILTGGTAFSPAYTTYSALVSYETSFNAIGEHMHVKLQLNVDNLTDNKDLVYTGYTQFGTSTQGAAYYFVAPRKFTLSANVGF